MRRGRPRGQRPRVGARDGDRVAAARLRGRRRRRGRQPPRRPADRDRDGRRAARHQQRQPARRRHPRAGPGAGHGRRHVAAGQLRHQPHDHAVGSVPGADGSPSRSWSGRTTCSPTSPTQVKDVDYRAAIVVDGAPPPDRPRHPRRPRQPPAAARPARRPRRAGAERDRGRARRDRRDPRPPPHRLDRDADPGARHVRPGRLHRHAGDRALPPVGHGAQPAGGDAAARRGPLRHGDPQLADHDRPRPRDRRVPRAGARGRRHRVRPRDVREHLRPRRACRRTRSSSATRRTTRPAAHSLRIAQVETVGQDLDERREELRRGARRRPRARGPRARGADGHRHHGQELAALRVGRAARRGARLRPVQDDDGRDRPAGRDEPQEAGRTTKLLAALSG